MDWFNNDNKVKEAGSNTEEVKLNKQKEIKKLVFRKNNNTQKYDLAQHSSHYSHSSHSSHSSHHSHHSHHSHYSSSGNMEFKAQDINAMGNAPSPLFRGVLGTFCTVTLRPRGVRKKNRLR